MATPAIIFKMSFSYNWHIGGYDFLEYMQRPEAFKKTNHLRDEYKDFIDYMSNSEKSDGLFDSVCDFLDEQDVEQYRRLEEHSQLEGCPKYYGVISFDNDFLKDNGVLTADGRLDVGLLKQLTREGMSQLISTSNKLDASNVYWNAAIHTNTDNIHIHYAMCEYHRLEDRQKIYRDKDMIEQPAFNALKSKVLNRIVGKDFVVELTKLEREVLLCGIKETAPREQEQLAQLASILPQEGGWQYGRKKMKPYLPRINECVDSIIRSDEALSRSYDEYIKKLDERTVTIKEHYYGSNKTQLYLAYKRNKLADFYNRAGNIVLQAIEERYLGKNRAHLSEEETFGGAMEQQQSVPRWENNAGTTSPPPPKKRPSFRGGNLAGDFRGQSQQARSTYFERGEQPYHLSEEEQPEPPAGRFNRALNSGRYIMDWSKDYKRACKLIYDKNSSDDDMVEAKRLLLSESNRGNVLAMCDLAKLSQSDEDTDTANALYGSALEGFKQLLQAAPPKKQPYIQYRIGKMYLYGLGTDKDEEQAFDYISSAASSGNKYAQFTLGNMYRYGTGTESDNEAALDCYERASSQGQPFASYAAATLQEQLGCYPEETIENNYKRALHGFLALDRDDSANDEVLTKIGMMYLNGKGIDEDLDTALTYLQRAARAKNERAIYTLGCVYYKQGEMDKAIEYLSAAEKKNNPYAAYKLGKIYTDKDSEQYDVDKAISHLEKAAQLNMMTAYLSLGKLYSDQEDEEHYDIGKAIAAYERAYSDNALATFAACKLAKLYLEEGENRNSDRAIEVLEGVPDNPYASAMLGRLRSDPADKEHYDIGKAIAAYERAYSDNALATFVACKLAKLYLEEGENRNSDRAIEVLEGVPDNPYASAMLGRLRSNQEDEEHYDISKAIAAYERAYKVEDMRQGVAVSLARLYLEEGENRNTTRALELLEEAAATDTNATFFLGRLLYNGADNISQNRTRGLQLIKAAAEEGNEAAQKYLSFLNRPSAPQNRNSSANLAKLINNSASVARHTYLMMSRIYRDMERHHAQALSEFEREQYIKDMKGRTY